MINYINEYFYFNQKEKRGILILLSIIFILIGANIFIIPYLEKPKDIDRNKFIIWVDSIMYGDNNELDLNNKTYFKFDSNQIISKNELNTGLSENHIQGILNNNPDKNNFFKKKYIDKKNSYQKFFIELNSCDSSELIKIYGIGPILASRIIKYRNLLGGYTHQSQLLEVYGIDSSKYNMIKNNFHTCDSSKIIKLNINTADFKTLLKHPYISYDFVNFIVNARKSRFFNSIDDLYDQTIISDSIFQKLIPYLKTKY